MAKLTPGAAPPPLRPHYDRAPRTISSSTSSNGVAVTPSTSSVRVESSRSGRSYR